MNSFLFEESGSAIQAVHDLRCEGIDPRSIRLHRWDDGYCVRVRGRLSRPLTSHIESLGGRSFEMNVAPTVDAPVATRASGRVRRQWWARS